MSMNGNQISSLPSDLLILIVEDEEMLSSMLSDYLQGLGFRTEVAENGIIGLEKIKNLQPNLIFLDMRMPRLSGFDLLKELQRLKIELPVIVTTSIQDTESIQRAKEAGVIDYLTKPYELTNIKEKLQSIFNLDSL